MLVGERKEKHACFFDPIGPIPLDGAGNSCPSGTASRPLSPLFLLDGMAVRLLSQRLSTALGVGRMDGLTAPVLLPRRFSIGNLYPLTRGQFVPNQFETYPRQWGLWT